MIERVKSIIAKQLRINAADISDDASVLEDLGADSLDIIELLMILEDETGIIIPDDDAADLKTVRQISDYIENATK